MGAYSNAVIADGAWSYWRFNETSGTNLADQLGHQAGTLNGSSWVLNQPSLLNSDPGDCALLNNLYAATEYIAFGTGAVICNLTNATVEFWIKSTDVTNAGVYYGERPPAGNDLWKTQPGQALSSQPSFVQRDDSGTLNNKLAGANAVWFDGNVHHAVYVKQGATIAFYRDGVQQGTTQNLLGTDTLTSGTIQQRFGGDAQDNTQSLKLGIFDELAIYKLALTPAQIANHYALGIAPPPSAQLLVPDADRSLNVSGIFV